MESKKWEEQQKRRANAETFRKRTNDSNPPPQKHLFTEPIRKNDQAREEFPMSDKVQDIFDYLNSHQKQKRSSSPICGERKRLKREIPKIDPRIEEIMGEIEGPDLLLPIEAPKKKSNEGKKGIALSKEDMEEVEKLMKPPVFLSPIRTKRQMFESIPRMRLRIDKESSTSEKPVYKIVQPAVFHQ